MATRLKETDVVIIGLGAAGGVAALPLAQAGLDVVGARGRDVADEAATSRPTSCATTSATGRRPCRRRSTRSRRSAPTPRRRRAARHEPSDDERGRRHLAALLGAELAPQSVGFQGRQRDDAGATARRGFRRDRRSRTGRSASTSSSRTTTRSSTRSACRARRATSAGAIDRARQHLRGRRARASIRCRRCAARVSPT